MWVLVSTACQSCGGDSSIRCIDHEPTDEDISENEREIGGMSCIYSFSVNAIINGDAVKNVRPLI